MLTNEENQSLSKKTRTIIILLIVIVGLLIRFIKIDQMPFTAADATLAADALELSNGVLLKSSILPAYSGITGTLFYIFGYSNLLARLFPILAGSSLIILAYLFTCRLNIKVAFIFALGIALDPLMVNLSRQIFTPLIALMAVLWAIYFIQKKQFVLTGVFLAVGFLSGYYFYIFVVLGFVLFALTYLVNKNILEELTLNLIKPVNWKTITLAFLTALLLLTTGFFLNLKGINGIGASLLSFILLVKQPYQLPVYHFVYVLIVFCALPLLGSILFFARKKENTISQHKALYAWCLVVCLFIIILFSKDNMGLMAILVIPFWFLLSNVLSESKFSFTEKTSVKIGILIAFVVLLVYLGLSLSRFRFFVPADPIAYQIALAIVAGILIILILFWLSSLLLGLKQSFNLLLIALIFFLSVNALSVTFRSINKDNVFYQLSLTKGPLLLSNEAQLESIEPFETYGKINFSESCFDVSDINHDIRWFVKDFITENCRTNPEFILSTSHDIPKYDDPYRGMRIELAKTIDWKSIDFKTYLLSILGPTEMWESENAILWARTNLFTGAIPK